MIHIPTSWLDKPNNCITHLEIFVNLINTLYTQHIPKYTLIYVIDKCIPEKRVCVNGMSWMMISNPWTGRKFIFVDVSVILNLHEAIALFFFSKVIKRYQQIVPFVIKYQSKINGLFCDCYVVKRIWEDFTNYISMIKHDIDFYCFDMIKRFVSSSIKFVLI